MVLQENEPVILYLVFVCVDLNVFEGSTKGQILHLVHMLMPGMCLAGLVAGSFAWTSVFFKLAGCLKATIGGFGKISFKSSFLVIVVQCFLRIDGMEGSFG